MPNIAAHIDDQRERHADLLRQAQRGELGARISELRRTERRTLLARLWRRRFPGRPAAATL